MMPKTFHDNALGPALRLLPSPMDTPSARAMMLEYNVGSGSHVNGPRPLTTICLQEQTMAATDSTKEFHSTCPDCGGVRVLRDKRQIGKRCFDCGMKARRDRASAGLIVHSRRANGIAQYERKCAECGAVAIVGKRDASTTVCRSCNSAKLNRTHGYSTRRNGEHPLYRVIKAAQDRCNRPGCKDYRWYGARGISVCDEWIKNPGAFVEWGLANGWQKGLELDRRDNDGDYCPENCRFITHAENCKNRRPGARARYVS